MFVKVLGAIDVLASVTFLMLVFGIMPWMPLTFFCAGLLLVKGVFFVALGDPGSAIDVLASVTLLLSLLIAPWSSLVWIFSLILLAKGVASFL